MDRRRALEILTADPSRTGIFTDFDGTLSEIVALPEDARPLEGAEDVVARLVGKFGLVGVVSGRSLEDLKQRFAPPGVLLAGAYGRERSDQELRRRTEGWEPVTIAAAAGVEGMDGVTLERKGAGVALHFRNAPDRGDQVLAFAEDLAREFELEVRPGRQVVELTAPGPGKGDAIAGFVEEFGLSTLMYAGDDIADLEAFDRCRDLDATTLFIAVASDESPEDLTTAADLVLEGPRAYLEFVTELAGRV